MHRVAVREDRDFESRRDLTALLGELPGKLDALVDRVDRLERRIDEANP
jgi:hypothetical protein